jgi:C1A family cysteine protease
MIKYHQNISLSEQQLVDCSKENENAGCEGGLMDDAFQYIINHGITTEDEYPYETVDGECRKGVQNRVTLSGFEDVEPSNELALKAAVAQQPVSVAIQADQMFFQFYHSGVLVTKRCGTDLDHGVLLVGYGETERGLFRKQVMPYWKIKNSWGPDWGQDGYILIERTDNETSDGACGVALSASYPTGVKKLTPMLRYEQYRHEHS